MQDVHIKTEPAAAPDAQESRWSARRAAIVRYVLLAALLITAYGPTVTARFGWMDDYLSAHWRPGVEYRWLQDDPTGHGRFLHGPSLHYGFQWAPHIDDFWRLRALGLGGVVALSCLLLWGLIRSGIRPSGAFAIACLAGLTPASAIHVAWGSIYSYPYAYVLALAGGYVALDGFDRRWRWRAPSLAIAALMLFAALHIFQPAAGLFFTPALWLLWREDRTWKERAHAALRVGLLLVAVCLAYLVSYRIAVHTFLANTPGVERGECAFDVPRQLRCFFGEILPAGVLFWGQVDGSKGWLSWVGALIVSALAAVAVFYPRSGRWIRAGGAVAAVAFCVAPILLPRDPYAPFRTFGALYVIVLQLAVQGFLELTRKISRPALQTGIVRAALGGTILLFVLLCRYHIREHFVRPNQYELGTLERYVQCHFREVPERLVFVLPPARSRMFAPRGGNQEFGCLSLWVPFNPYAMLNLVFAESFPEDYARKGRRYLSVETTATLPGNTDPAIPVINGRTLFASDP